MPLQEINTPDQYVSHEEMNGGPDDHAIAKIAARFIKEGQTIFIGGAAKHEAMLSYLPNDIPYTIVTNAVEIACYTMKMNNIETYLMGGKVNKSGSMTDVLAHQFTSLMRYDVCFLFTEALTERGLTTETPEIALFYRHICENATSIVALAGRDKFNEDKFAKICPAEKLDVIITDRHISEEKMDVFKALGIEVIVAVG
ncbi:DeoR/GlpR family DNA-binding transcription regulator [Virgibacillus halophilus]|uniref:DeoR/GlpR family DNA-binding transcription regulator n=1 Tax=Tigheibacillus halophilus TaxID=361280 RepID=A0ABU5CBP1_9BACI|nr:DeoR/GlpR family DNA-binding transcription regulator [Virgibacillus halophilus]